MKKLLIVLGLVLIVIFGIGFLVNYLDNPLVKARARYKFDKQHVYIITKTDSSGASQEKFPPFVSAIYEKGEPRNTAGLSWRRIGESKVDLEQFVDKPVYIDGEYFEGYPILINQPPSDHYGVSEMQPVI